ncbi:MAG: hypothetical protein JNM17_16230 [Archangium sp.]|nr:hypothetical protein [Archangium sp.]
MSKGFDIKRWLLPGPAALAALLIIAPAATAPLEANDLFFHLASGRWLLEHGSFPTTDPFSPTATAQAPHEWAWGVLCELSVRTLGGAGPKLLVSALVAALFFALFRALDPRDEKKALVKLTLFGCALSTLSFTWYQERPYHLGHLMFVLWLLALRAWEEDRTLKRAALVVGLSLAWANLHGSWPLGPAFLVASLIGHQIEGTNLDRRGAGLLLACIGVAAIHPGGVSNLLYPLQHQLLGSTQTIEEWRSLDFSFGFTWVLVVLAAGAVASFVKKDARAWHVLLPALLLVAAAFWSRRHAPFAGIALAVACARLFEGPQPRVDAILNRWLGAANGFVWPAVLWIALAVGAARTPRTVRESIHDGWYPIAGLDALTSRPPGRVLAKFEWGSVVSALGAGRYQTFIDSRNDPYAANVHEAYAMMRTLKPGWKDKLAEFKPDYVLWGGVGRDFSWPLVWALEAEGWQRVAEDDVGVLLVRPPPSPPPAE